MKSAKKTFHIGRFLEIDDFLWLWQKFEEDDLWEAAGYDRLCSKPEDHAYVITDYSILDFCVHKFNREVVEATNPGTIIIEFARGKEDGGYEHVLNTFSDEILKDAAILFNFTSYEEACRRNEARYKEKLKHTILAHKVPEEDMIRFGRDIDWLEITNDKPNGYLTIRDHKIPFVTMDNERELTEEPQLKERYKAALDQLITLYN